MSTPEKNFGFSRFSDFRGLRILEYRIKDNQPVMLFSNVLIQAFLLLPYQSFLEKKFSISHDYTGNVAMKTKQAFRTLKITYKHLQQNCFLQMKFLFINVQLLFYILQFEGVTSSFLQ